MLFDNTDFDYEISFLKIPGSDFNKEIRDSKFLSPEEGFLRGNLMKDEYVPYKNLTYFKLTPQNEQETLLLKLMAYSFTINDLNLYLDFNPKDQQSYELFKKCVYKCLCVNGTGVEHKLMSGDCKQRLCQLTDLRH